MFSHPACPIEFIDKSTTFVLFPNCETRILAPCCVNRLSEKLKCEILGKSLIPSEITLAYRSPYLKLLKKAKISIKN